MVADVTYEAPNSGRGFSGTIWASCLQLGLPENGDGYFVSDDFLSGISDTIASGDRQPVVGHSMNLLSDDDTVLAFKASEVGGYQDIETDGDNNDAWTIFSEPFCKLADNGKKIWLEARLELGSASADQGFFFGLGEEATQTLEVIDDGRADLMDETMIGFVLLKTHTDTNATVAMADATINIVARKDGDELLVIAEDVTNLAVLDTVLGSGSKAALAANTEYKLGLRFNGTDKVEFFVNSVRVFTWTLNSTYYDPDKTLVTVASLKTGAAQSVAFDWIRFAAQY